MTQQDRERLMEGAKERLDRQAAEFCQAPVIRASLAKSQDGYYTKETVHVEMNAA